MMRIIAAVQARLDSTRLPGKVLKPLLGKPMLYHVMERLKESAYLTESVIIVPMKDFADISTAVPGFKVLADGGVAENDLVSRYWHAAMSFGADIIVRICADNPCVDIKNVDLLVKAYLADPADNATLRTNAGDYKDSKWPMSLGAEIYPFNLLKDLNEASPSSLREHPHLPFHIMGKVWEPDCPYDWLGPLGFTVNTDADYAKAVQIYGHFGNNKFTTQELLDYYV